MSKFENIKVGNYILLEPVGIGTFTQVIKVQNVLNKNYYAMKLFS